MPIFNAQPQGKRMNIDINNPRSVLCKECQVKFKEWRMNGGSCPKACDVCAEKLKNKMYEGRYPDR